MTHYYQISTGAIFHDSELVGAGYSGHGEGLNNPAMCIVHDVGPLPPGLYTMEAPIDHPHVGAYAIRLNPDPENAMHDRDGFYWHGDNAAMNHTASDGCIVSALALRKAAWETGDHLLRVVIGPPPLT